MGSLNHPVTTQSAEAQKFFNQGLTLLYGFNYPEAARSFRRAVELDPEMPMGWWGLAVALGPNINEPLFPQNSQPAYDAARRAKSLAPRAAPRERMYIDAVVAHYVPDPQPADRSSLDRAYAEAMKRLAEAWPDDLDAQTIYAESLMNLTPWRLWSLDGKPGTHTLEIVRLLESVLDRDPGHLGANHYYIHAVEASPNPEKALPSGYRLGPLAPGAGHLVHMPAHVFMRTGDYERAAQANIDAAEADRKYFETSGADGIYSTYWSHNWHFLSAAYSMQGRYRDAFESVRRAAGIMAPMAKQIPIFESFLSFPVLVQLRFHRWEELASSEAPPDGSITSRNVWRMARAHAFAALGRKTDAERERKAFLDGLRDLPEDRTYGQNPERAVMQIGEKTLDARIAAASGDWAKAVRHLRDAVAAEDKLNYNEPADWYYPPTREALGAALLRTGQAAEAEQVFRGDLRINRRNGRSLFGLMESLKAQGKMDEAALIEQQYKTAWAKADAPLRLEDLF
jgi:tetratricopeptide (TPR) repeat protein